MDKHEAGEKAGLDEAQIELVERLADKVRPKSSCPYCYGRGWTGKRILKDGTKEGIPCHCIRKQIDNITTQHSAERSLLEKAILGSNNEKPDS